MCQFSKKRANIDYGFSGCQGVTAYLTRPGTGCKMMKGLHLAQDPSGSLPTGRGCVSSYHEVRSLGGFDYIRIP